jgi:hypothetical protein
LYYSMCASVRSGVRWNGRAARPGWPSDRSGAPRLDHGTHSTGRAGARGASQSRGRSPTPPGAAQSRDRPPEMSVLPRSGVLGWTQPLQGHVPASVCQAEGRIALPGVLAVHPAQWPFPLPDSARQVGGDAAQAERKAVSDGPGGARCEHVRRASHQARELIPQDRPVWLVFRKPIRIL